MSTQSLVYPSAPQLTPCQRRGSYQPRPYQAACVAALAEARKNGTKKGLVVMASGLGKTVITILDLQQFLQESPGARILCLCHQESILLQSKTKFRKFFGEEYSYGMFTGSYKTAHPVNFLFATFQTMRDHREEFSPDAFDYIVVDEAHHTAAETYRPTADYFQPQFLLGLTATKDRMDGQDILDTYEQVLYQMDIYDGWVEGWLARVDYRIMLDDLNQEEFEKYVGPHATDEKVSLSQLNRTIFAPQHDEGIVASIREQTADLGNPSIFIFCSSIGHANAMAHQFGGEAAVIHSDQSAVLNEAILSGFRSGEIRIIISVDKLNEGIDVPEADAVVFLRATESSTIFFQQLGRGLRISGEKRTVRVLDYVANIERIAMILEMEDTAKQRIPASPTYSPSVDKPDPLIINIPATKFKVQRVDVERLLRLVQSQKRGSFETEEELLAAARAYAAELGHPDYLTEEEINSNKRFPCWETLRQGYGSLGNFLLAAGLRPRRKARKRFNTKGEVKKALQRKISQLGGKAPTRRQLEQDLEMPAMWYILKFYPSYNAALLDAGVTRLNSEKGATDKYPDEKMKKEAEKMRKDLGRTPTIQEWNDNPKTCSASVLEKRHGSYNQAMVVYGLVPNKRHASINNANKRQDVFNARGELSAEQIVKLQAIVRKTKKRIRMTDLNTANGVPTATYFYNHQWTTRQINEAIHAEQILAELAKENN